MMSRGKPVPEPGKQKFPTFETVRQRIDGEYWFPTWTEADEVLQFDNGNRVHLRQLILFRDFQKFDVSATIKYQGQDEDPASDKPEKPEPPGLNP